MWENVVKEESKDKEVKPKKSKKKIIITIVAIVVIVLLLIAAFIGYHYSQLKVLTEEVNKL